MSPLKIFLAELSQGVWVCFCLPNSTVDTKLKGYDGTYQIRIGDYRIIYRIQDQEMLIIILSSIHRKDAY